MPAAVSHARLGVVRTLGFPVRLDLTPADISRGAPVFGEHTRDVMVELGYEEKEIARLVNESVICRG